MKLKFGFRCDRMAPCWFFAQKVGRRSHSLASAAVAMVAAVNFLVAVWGGEENWWFFLVKF